MIHDEKLKSSLDYSEGQKEAAYRVLIEHYRGGIDALAKLFSSSRQTKIIEDMKKKLEEKFASPDHAGPADVVAFMDPDNEEDIAFRKRDAYEQMQALLQKI